MSEDNPARGHTPAPAGATTGVEHGQTGRAGLGKTPGGDGAEAGAAAETDIWVGRTHWKHYADRIAVWLMANAAVALLTGWLAARVEWLSFKGSFWIVSGVFLLSGFEVVIRRVVLKVINHRYRLTSQRLFIERGILSRTVDQTELIRVDDVRLRQSFLDRLFGLGSVAIVSTDATDRETLIEGIPEPNKVAEAIRNRMRAMRRHALFMEKL